MSPALEGWPETMTRREAEAVLTSQALLVQEETARAPLNVVRGAVLLGAAREKARRGKSGEPWGSDGPGVIVYEGIEGPVEGKVQIRLGGGPPVIGQVPAGTKGKVRAAKIVNAGEGSVTVDLLIEEDTPKARTGTTGRSRWKR